MVISHGEPGQPRVQCPPGRVWSEFSGPGEISPHSFDQVTGKEEAEGGGSKQEFQKSWSPGSCSLAPPSHWQAGDSCWGISFPATSQVPEGAREEMRCLWSGIGCRLAVGTEGGWAGPNLGTRGRGQLLLQGHPGPLGCRPAAPHPGRHSQCVPQRAPGWGGARPVLRPHPERPTRRLKAGADGVSGLQGIS